ncbi:MAG: YdjY domain-containing protein [bacterium]
MPSVVDPGNAIRLGTVVVDAHDRSVLLTGHVNQVEGAIELFACGPRGKTHESVLVLDVYPVDLQTGLLLIGARHGKPAEGMGMRPPDGDPLDVFVEWQDGGKTVRRRAEAMIRNSKTKRVLPKTAWIFTGSTFEDGRFKALVEESLIVSYWDPWAIINIGSDVGADDEILSVNTRNVPPLGTPVTVLIKRR